MKTSLRPEKIEERGEDVVKMKQFRVYKFILGLYHVRTTSTLRAYYVHRVSTRFFLLRGHHAHPVSSTFLLRCHYDQADRTTRLPRFQHVLTIYLTQLSIQSANSLS